MLTVSKRPKSMLLLAMLAGTAPVSLAAQSQELPQEASDGAEVMATVYGTLPTPDQMTKGPQVEGIISARSDGRMRVRTADGNDAIIAIADYTRIKSKGGFLGLNSNKLAADALLNGLPVTVETLQWDGGLVASEVDLKSKDLRTASMIRTGTDQRFAEQTAATEALPAASATSTNIMSNTQST